MRLGVPVSIFAVVLLISADVVDAKKCTKRLAGSRTYNPGKNGKINLRQKQQDVYFWPSLTDHERRVIKDAFHQIQRRTCLRFKVLDYKPWYHADKWEGRPYVIIRKSKKFTGYSDNDIEEVSKRSILYLTDGALNKHNFNTSRGAVMSQVVRFMGLKEELYRPDASSYIQPIDENEDYRRPSFADEQLQWPFDPESVTIPLSARDQYSLTYYCPAREDRDIGAGQRVGLLTRWDSVKLNSMYCPHQVGYADPRKGPCNVSRSRKQRKSKKHF